MKIIKVCTKENIYYYLDEVDDSNLIEVIPNPDDRSINDDGKSQAKVMIDLAERVMVKALELAIDSKVQIVKPTYKK